ncbi:MAG TPA: hypothetical protein VER05_11480 [Cellulomonas sp.]|nr:hypothetical protein [Cellulomonas sp.]
MGRSARATVSPAAPAGHRLTRRHLRAREADAAPGSGPGTVVLRPPRWPVWGVAAVLAAPPRRDRGESLVAHALAHGAASGPALALYAWWALLAAVATLTVTRSATTLRARGDGSLELVVQGPVRRSTYDLRQVRRVALVRIELPGGASRRRAVLLDARGRVVAAPRTHRDLWVRADAEALLGPVGILVDRQTRRVSARALEATCPGSTRWVDRLSGWHLLAGALALSAAAFALLVLAGD